MWENQMFRCSLGDKDHAELMHRLNQGGYEVVGLAVVGVKMYVLAKRRIDVLVG